MGGVILTISDDFRPDPLHRVQHVRVRVQGQCRFVFAPFSDITESLPTMFLCLLCFQICSYTVRRLPHGTFCSSIGLLYMLLYFDASLIILDLISHASSSGTCRSKVVSRNVSHC